MLDLSDGGRIRQLRPPLLPEMLQPLSDRCQVVQFSTALKDHEYIAVARFMELYPHVTLRVYGDYDNTIRDLRFLLHFPKLLRFQADVLWRIDSYAGLEFLRPDLEFLGLGATRKRQSLAPLERFSQLKSLYLEGQTKDIDVLRQLAALEKLTLRSITLPDLSLLRSMRRLWSLDIKLGGTRDLRLLPTIGELKYLELWMIRGLDDVAPLAAARTLQYVFLQALRRVTLLPDMSRMRALRKVHLESMKGITSLEPLARAPALEELVVLDMRQLATADFRPFANHPRLRAATIALGSARKKGEIDKLLHLPRAAGKAAFTYV